MEVLELAGIGEIKVRRSANIKYLRIRMAPGRGVWVSVPFGVSRKQVEKFLEENREWILKNRKDMKVYEEDTGVGLRYGYIKHNSGFSRQPVSMLRYFCSLRVTFSGCMTDLPVIPLPCLHRIFLFRLMPSFCVPTVLI